MKWPLISLIILVIINPGCFGSGEDIDRDADGIENAKDNCPDIFNDNQSDYDEDGEGDLCDLDPDGDGYWLYSDAFPYDPSEWYDTDKDGIGNNQDTDDDNDGFLDNNDFSPLGNGKIQFAIEQIGGSSQQDYPTGPDFILRYTVDKECDGVVDAGRDMLEEGKYYKDRMAVLFGDEYRHEYDLPDDTKYLCYVISLFGYDENEAEEYVIDIANGGATSVYGNFSLFADERFYARSDGPWELGNDQLKANVYHTICTPGLNYDYEVNNARDGGRRC